MLKLCVVVYFLLAASLGLLLAPASADDAEQGPEDELQHSRIFLEKKVAEIASSGNLFTLIMGTSLKDKLESELERLSRKVSPNDDEVRLLRELREFLYGELDEQQCEFDLSEPEFRPQNLKPNSNLASLVEAKVPSAMKNLIAESANDNNNNKKFDELLEDRILKQVEFCKPIWDRKLVDLLESELSEQNRVLLLKFYNNLIAFEASKFVPADGIEHETALEDFEKFARLMRNPPKSASLLLFMHEQFPKAAASLQLDENMQNPNLDKATYGKTLQQTVAPFCQTICPALKSMGDFYTNFVFNLKVGSLDTQLTEQTSARLAKLYRDQQAQVTTALVVETACCNLLDARVGDKIVRQLFLEITGKKRSS